MESSSSPRTLLNSGAMVGYVCTRKSHLVFAPDFTLTIHNGDWAFCHHATAVGAHRWMATGGIPLGDVQRSRIAWELATE
jgi:hypothetical protein